MSSTVMEELMGNRYNELAFTPHNFHDMRQRFQAGYASPDDVRMVHCATFNRKHRYREHYMKEVGTDMSSMIEF